VADSEGPLSDLRVLDASQILAGPFCTMLLADLGAEVIKIEPPSGGDRARDIGPPAGPDPSHGSAYFVSVNRGKKSVALDIRAPEGREILLGLAGVSDIFVENFKPGTMDRLGLGPHVLMERNPRLIHTSISGFGQTGPYAKRPALDIIVQALGGMMSVTGEEGGPPIRPGVSQGDSIAGMFAAVAILSAIHQRERTGRGQRIDMSMLDGQVTLLENAFARYFATGKVPGPMGTRHPALTPFQAFATSDGHIAVALLHDDPESWRRFSEILGKPELASDERFVDGASRTEHADTLIPILREAFLNRPRAEWLRSLMEAGIACAPVQSIDEVTRDPQIRNRGMLRDIPHGDGTFNVANTPFRFGEAHSGPTGPAPLLGEHTGEILGGVLNITQSDLERLCEAGVIRVSAGMTGRSAGRT
jgi:crotonobetainyl-CoA:carnitine CoA-transferase CaiB-like acyl-CoA transferase